MRRIGTGAAGVLAVLILTFAPTSATFQLAQYTDGDGWDTADPIGASLFLVRLENEYLPDNPIPLSAGANGGDIVVENPESVLFQIIDGANDDSAVYSLETGIPEGFPDETAILTLLSSEMPADGLIPLGHDPAEPQEISEQDIPLTADPEPAHTATVSEMTVASSIFIQNPDYVEIEEDVLPVGVYRRIAEDRSKIAPGDQSMASIGAYIWPADGNLTSRFGRRSAIVGSVNHMGIDVCGRYGDSIYAADGGEVVFSGWSRTFGHYIRIEHDNGHITLYAHCSELLVGEGGRVWQGQEIARMGRTGIASGVHLHFEIIINDVNIDPLSYLP